MAFRLARAISSSSSPIWRSTAEISGRQAGLRLCSSHSSSTTKPGKPQKKTIDRLSAVIDIVNDRKLPPELRGPRISVRSETEITNVVERRIWQSMEEGQFEKLPGKGKPLNLDTNPHADPAEDTLYRVLSKSGFAPEWVELNKDIRTRVSEWRSGLTRVWTCKHRDGGDRWSEISEALKGQLREINDKVFRYNLIAPFGRQMCGLKWEREINCLEEE